MMKSIEYIKREHKIIEGLSDMLEASSKRMSEKKEVPPWMLRENVELLQIYTNGSFKDKEDIIFSFVENRGGEVPRMEFLEEHDIIKKYEKFLLKVIEAYDLGYHGAISIFARYSIDYINNLRRRLKLEKELLGRYEDSLKDIDVDLLNEFKKVDRQLGRIRERGLVRMENLKKEYRRVAA